MESKAIARYSRYSPQKVEQVLKLIRGKRLNQIFTMLSFVPKEAVTLVEKTIHSAAANFGGSPARENLYLKAAWVGKGPVLKRMRAAAMGRGAVYTRKTCHLTVVVGELNIGKQDGVKEVNVGTKGTS